MEKSIICMSEFPTSWPWIYMDMIYLTYLTSKRVDKILGL